ncbi:redox-sensitive transcriptional activator SoxR [Mameliella sediminis]|uniref:redox-sensitive transcriptional activator SoxR n=1 Tax=Mameliella sediminis TaxID=2836866 RepID=UPI001C48398A|nr:redox-sensitive transcriptional activator SoxR [Mameliella sediminis]MBY6116391.1 redox-sensitive transcriptional activator SoxR [Antarctobacter heliothermus]MBY6145583.1 redox-sensitive transcriptional activator SoxR [Mameliella alba]MBV7393693.1 redox-sensitive transcriptional activator SoxR [Mameliella sediminis]MBY6160907.1 redox-sensitive transcriptional activator SoxR [Mameliella alba]MBY6169377.1 redox-sensitive transcriptional activator SoxR [Mameliella alba]
MPKDGLSISHVAQRTGLAASAIRHYEAEGLVFPDRNAGGQRRYRAADIRRLSFVMIAQQLGFTLAEIRAEMDRLPRDRAPAKADWSRISRRFGRVLDARIARMQALRDRLDGCIGCGCLSLQSCALYNPEDRAARSGQGPRYLMGDRPLSE